MELLRSGFLVVSMSMTLTLASTTASAFVVDYGDVNSGPYTFTDITESNVVDRPLYFAPQPVTGGASGIRFLAKTYTAQAIGVGVDLLDGQLNFSVSSQSDDLGIDRLVVKEAGDFTFVAPASVVDNVLAAGVDFFGTVTVTEVAGEALDDAIVLPLIATFFTVDAVPVPDGSFEFLEPPVSGDPGIYSWGLMAEADLTGLGGPVTAADVVFNNVLNAISLEPVTAASISKKSVTITVIPEPASLALLGLGVGLAALRRRSRDVC